MMLEADHPHRGRIRVPTNDAPPQYHPTERQGEYKPQKKNKENHIGLAHGFNVEVDFAGHRSCEARSNDQNKRNWQW